MNIIVLALALDTEERWQKFDDLFKSVLIASPENYPPTTISDEIKHVHKNLAHVAGLHTNTYQTISHLEGKEFAEEVKKITNDKKNPLLHGRILFEKKQSGMTPERFLRSSKTLSTPSMLQFIQKLCYENKFVK